MKAFILCAGYATRLGKLTENQPKALLEIQNKSFLQLLFDNLEEIDDVDEVVIISNHKFYKNFIDAFNAGKMLSSKKITILDDGTTSNDTRLGAVGDVAFALKQLDYHGESMILVADNYFDFHLDDLHNFYLKNNHGNTVFGKFETDEKILMSGAVANIDENGKCLSMREKPKQHEIDGNYAVGAFYFYNTETTELIHDYLKEPGHGDAPGYFPSWLVQNGKEVYLYDIHPYHYVDVGTIEAYNNIDKKIEQCRQEVRAFENENCKKEYFDFVSDATDENKIE